VLGWLVAVLIQGVVVGQEESMEEEEEEVEVVLEEEELDPYNLEVMGVEVEVMVGGR